MSASKRRGIVSRRAQLSEKFLNGLIEAISNIPNQFPWNYDNNRTSPPPANMWTWPNESGGVDDDKASPIDLFIFGDMTSEETGEDELVCGIPDDDPRNEIGEYLEYASPCFVRDLVDELLSLRVIKSDLLEALEEIASVIDESGGVAGWHLNGAVAPWDEFGFAQKIEDVIKKARGEE